LRKTSKQGLTKGSTLSAEKKLDKHRLRLLSVEFIGDERIQSNIATSKKAKRKTGSTSLPTPPKFYRSVYYDYDNNRSLIIKGNIDKKGEPKEIIESREQPIPNREEFEDAVRILQGKEPEINDAIENNSLMVYRPMPPLIN
jgi:hypothetical protein